jgi:RNA polymerase sigma-70 factor (ECF subfamily)
MLDQPPLPALDASRFAEIFAEYQVALFRYLRARTNNTADADDLTSETFLRAWRFRDKYVEKGVILSWLFTVARGTLIDWARGKRSRCIPKTLSLNDKDDETGRQIEPVCSWSQDEFTAVDDDDWMAEVLTKHVTPMQCKVIVMSELGFEGEEIAEAMGMRYGAIRALKMRGLRNLRGRMMSL